jgi:hypothetical protein
MPESNTLMSNAPRLFFIAREAYEKTKAPDEGRGAGLWEAQVSVVFSAITLEAFMNELVTLAGMHIRLHSDAERIKDFANRIERAETERESIRHKYMQTREIFTNKPYDKSAAPYQDFALLLDLRNAIVHTISDVISRNPQGEIERRYQRLINKLRSKNILHETDGNMDFMSLISTPETAQWACNAAVQIIHSIVDVLPEDFMRTHQKDSTKRGFPLSG